MKIKPICDCKENKVITGTIDGEMIWRFKSVAEMRQGKKKKMFTPQEHAEMDKQDAYEANSD